MPIPSFDETVLFKICEVLTDTSGGLTGSQIGQLLQATGIDDCSLSSTKRYRLNDALISRQQIDRCGNNVVAFIQAALNPVRYVQNHAEFEVLRDELNKVLGFAGYQVNDEGKVVLATRSKTLSDAQKRANRLRRQLQERQVHADVLKFCKAELLQDNYFHAVFEATKSVADKIRCKSGLGKDGSQLVDAAFGFKLPRYPILAFNSLQTETEQSEHRGLANLIRGMFGTFRNTTAHAPKITWKIDEQDALDLLSIASLLHRRLDTAVNTHAGS